MFLMYLNSLQVIMWLYTSEVFWEECFLILVYEKIFSDKCAETEWNKLVVLSFNRVN